MSVGLLVDWSVTQNFLDYKSSTGVKILMMIIAHMIDINEMLKLT